MYYSTVHCVECEVSSTCNTLNSIQLNLMLVILNTTGNYAITYTNYVDMHMFTILGYLYVPFVVNNALLLELHTHIALGICAL